MREEAVKDGFLAPHVELLSVRGFKRVCHTCCDPEECAADASETIAAEAPLPRCPRRKPCGSERGDARRAKQRAGERRTRIPKT